MNDQQRADLDAWFAEADDVLDNWWPGLDAMVAPASREPDDGPLPVARIGLDGHHRRRETKA